MHWSLVRSQPPEPIFFHILKLDGAPGQGRTGNLRLRRPTLYPVELRVPLECEILISSARRFKAHPAPGHGWPSHSESTLFFPHPRSPSTPPTIRWALPFDSSFPASSFRSPTKPQMFRSSPPAHKFPLLFVFHWQTTSPPDPAASPPSTKFVSPCSHSDTTPSPVHPPIRRETSSL